MPSANAANCRETLPVWRARGYRVAILQDRVRFEADADLIVREDEYRGWPWAINRLCQHSPIRDATVVIAAGDDMLPDPSRSASELARDYMSRFPDGFGIMQPTGDQFLNSDTFCGSPWFGQGWMKRAFGGHGPIPRHYRHNWADMELHWVARELGVLWERPEVAQSHQHFARASITESATPPGQQTPDPPAYWANSVGRYDIADAQTFSHRAWAGFPGAAPLGACQPLGRTVFPRSYRSIAEVHLHRLIGRPALDACRRMREAVALCRARGWENVALFGNGAHTEAVWSVLSELGFLPRVILDHAATDGVPAARDGIQVCRPGPGTVLGLDAVVLSGNSVEDQLLAQAQGFGLPVVRLYGELSPRVFAPSVGACPLGAA